jgi:diguanylate cyclase (GGDEF)-like protein/putative nucleotidyltransferase with HDIG domain
MSRERLFWRPGALQLAIAAGVVFAILIAFVFANAIRVERSLDRARQADDDARRYALALNLVTEQESLFHEYDEGLHSSPQIRREFEAAGDRLASVLGSLATSGGQDAARLEQGIRSYQTPSVAYFGAIDAGRARPAHQLARDEIHPSFHRAGLIARGDADRSAAKAADATAELDDRQELNLMLLPIAFLLGGTALFMLLRRSHRAQAGRARAEAEVRLLEQAALLDGLTGLPNHRAFYEHLDPSLRKTRGQLGALCLLMMDCDGFKQINEMRGHQVGDAMLRGLAAQLREVVGEKGQAYRFGGDEFAAILPGCTALEGAGIAERLNARLRDDDELLGVTVGVTESDGTDSASEVVRRADLALIHAQRSNRQLEVYSSDIGYIAQRDRRRSGKMPRQALASALARAVDAKDSYTHSHSHTVSSLCVLLGERLALPPPRVAKLRLAGLLHDVGKIGTPDEILQKAGRLSDAEFDLIKQHPVKSAEIARAAMLEEEAEWILHHHERLDGRGYPDGLAGDQIPLESRIILVADAFEALTSDRPYRRGRPAADALDEILDHAGTQFDPDVVIALGEVIGRTRGEGWRIADTEPVPA